MTENYASCLICKKSSKEIIIGSCGYCREYICIECIGKHSQRHIIDGVKQMITISPSGDETDIGVVSYDKIEEIIGGCIEFVYINNYSVMLHDENNKNSVYNEKASRLIGGRKTYGTVVICNKESNLIGRTV